MAGEETVDEGWRREAGQRWGGGGVVGVSRQARRRLPQGTGGELGKLAGLAGEADDKNAHNRC